MTPLVSILTPSFNQARWLSDNLASVARHSYRQIEHIVMDGGSSDGSVAILKAAGPHVVAESKPDRGQSHALNKALMYSQGDIIGWLNADDAYFDPYAVEAAVDILQANPHVDVVYGHAALVNGNGLLLHMIWVPPFNRFVLQRHNFIIQPATFIRRTALGTRMVDEFFDFAMDRELWLRLSLNSRFRRLDRVLAIDRHHLGRKVYTQKEVGTMEGQRLNERYQIPDTRRTRSLCACSKVVFRILGARLIRNAQTEWAFQGSVDSHLNLWNRQLLQRRAAMPSGVL
jgi:glycosyltransferase involved in cell wall biosynthesis